MPLVRISLRAGRSQGFKELLGDCVYRAMHETMNVPSGDRFQVITEHDASGLIYDPEYLDVRRSDGVIFIQVTLNTGRTLEIKRAFYTRVGSLLTDELSVRPEDILINLVEVPKENWSFGDGEAQYAPS
jgi:4-oxalocrotonate tautomerase